VQRTRRVRLPLRVGIIPVEDAQDTDEVVIDDNPYHLVGAFHGPVSIGTRTSTSTSQLTISRIHHTKEDTMKSYVAHIDVSCDYGN
jgi:hypothetical protein